MSRVLRDPPDSHHFQPIALRLSLVRRWTGASLPCLVLSLLFLTGCTSEDPSEEIEVESESLYFEPIGYGQRAALSDTLEMAFRSEAAWSVYRDSLNPIAPFDSVDFEQAIVLLVALPQVTSGYSIEFASVDRVDSVVVAEYVVNAPSEDCLTAFAEAVPFQAVLVRRTEMPVEFRHFAEEYRCTFGPRRRVGGAPAN